MKREFNKTCEGCPNFVLLSRFADQCELLEKAALNSDTVTVSQVGRVGCRGSVMGMASRDRVSDKETLSRTCPAEKPIPPHLTHILLREAGLTAYSEVVIEGIPELVGKPTGGALYVQDFDSPEVAT